MFAQKSSIFCQTLESLVISVLYQSPPPTPPAQTFLAVASLGSNTKALVRPPILFGPRSFHLIPPIATLRVNRVLISTRAFINLSMGILPVAGSRISAISASILAFGSSTWAAIVKEKKINGRKYRVLSNVFFIIII